MEKIIEACKETMLAKDFTVFDEGNRIFLRRSGHTFAKADALVCDPYEGWGFYPRGYAVALTNLTEDQVVELITNNLPQ